MPVYAKMDHNFVFREKTPIFPPKIGGNGWNFLGQKLGKIAENCDHCIDPWRGVEIGQRNNFKDVFFKDEFLTITSTKPVSYICIWQSGYDHYFRLFLPIFVENVGVFLENQCYDQNFAKFTFVLSQKRQFFSLNFSAKIFKKIITSVPGYDHYFRQFLPIFVENVGVFLENQCYDQFFVQKPTLFSVKKAIIFSPNLSAKTFSKSVPSLAVTTKPC
jgi:hypothetical protein